MDKTTTEVREALSVWAEGVGCRLAVLFGSAAAEGGAPRDMDVVLDFEIVAASIGRAVEELGRFLEIYRERLDEDELT